ncbi:hypothetical protein TNCV_3230801 [Trichonephila clavipes]|nr:hypothetical protein TNCV_3230801 [Trichonephila clavipes]
MYFGEYPLLTLGIWGKDLVGVTNLIFLGTSRRLYHTVLVATSKLFLFNKAGKFPECHRSKTDQASPSHILVVVVTNAT